MSNLAFFIIVTVQKEALQDKHAVLILGSRQFCKTTLAQTIGEHLEYENFGDYVLKWMDRVRLLLLLTETLRVRLFKKPVQLIERTHGHIDSLWYVGNISE